MDRDLSFRLLTTLFSSSKERSIPCLIICPDIANCKEMIKLKTLLLTWLYKCVYKEQVSILFLWIAHRKFLAVWAHFLEGKVETLLEKGIYEACIAIDIPTELATRLVEKLQRGRQKFLKVSAAAPSTTRQRPPPNENFTTEEGLYDCIVVGGGISGLVTAQAFQSDHAQTVKRCGFPDTPHLVLETLNAGIHPL